MPKPSALIGFVCLVAIFGDFAVAQVPYQRYVPPSGSPLPFYLDYFRAQTGVLDQYNQFVAPKGQLENRLRTMSAKEHVDFRAAERQFQQIRPSEAAPTGTAAGFMNYSHYYGSQGTGANSRRRPSR
jgi:hypothetical protein